MHVLNLLPLLLMAGAPPPANLETIARGSLSGVDRPRDVVVRTEEEWRALWQEHAPGQEVPRVDFATRTVVGVFMGSRRTAGYAVEITGVERRADAAVARVHERRPGTDEILAQVITSPFHIVSVPRLVGPVTFSRSGPDEHGSRR